MGGIPPSKEKSLNKEKSLTEFEMGYRELSNSEQQRLYKESVKRYANNAGKMFPDDPIIIEIMNKVLAEKASLQHSINPVYHSNSKTGNVSDKVIYVNTFAGNSMTFDFTKYLTVGALKTKIKEKKLLDCDTDYQKLFVLPDTVLEDDSKTLSSYGVTAETKIELLCNVKYLKPVNFNVNPNNEKLHRGMCISPDGKHIYIPADVKKTKICVINTSDGSIKESIDLSNGNNSLESVDAVYLSPDGASFFVIGLKPSEFRQVFQKRSTYNAKFEYEANEYEANEPNNRYRWSGMCISPNSNFIFIADMQTDAILVFDASNGSRITQIGTPHPVGKNEKMFDRPLDMCMSETGELFIINSHNNRVQVFNANKENATFIRMLKPMIEGKHYRASIVDVSPDGKYLYITRKDENKIHILDASNGAHLDTVTVGISNTYIKDICASPTGDFLFVLFDNIQGKSRIVKFAIFGSTVYSISGNTMGGKHHKKRCIRHKRSKSRVRRVKKNGTKRIQQK